MRIEFVGPSGAGKSKLLKDVYPRLKPYHETYMHTARGFADIHGNRRNSWQNSVDRLAALLENPRLAAWCLRNVADGAQASYFLSLCRRVRYMTHLESRAGIHLVNEGPRRALLVALPGARHEPEAVLDLIPKPELIICVTADPEISVQRLLHRGGPAMRGQDTTSIQRTIEKQRVWLERVTTGMPTVHVDTTNGQDHSPSVADDIMAFIKANRTD